jgi:hypothetical protein
LPLLTTAHDSGFWRLAKPYLIKGFHLQSSADLPRRTACPLLVLDQKVGMSDPHFTFNGPDRKPTDEKIGILSPGFRSAPKLLLSHDVSTGFEAIALALVVIACAE